jgi:hypothetical protein
MVGLKTLNPLLTAQTSKMKNHTMLLNDGKHVIGQENILLYYN